VPATYAPFWAENRWHPICFDDGRKHGAVAKEKRHTVSLTADSERSSLDAILAESRALRRQATNDLNREAPPFRRVSRPPRKSRRSSSLDEQSA
jgi:hypothetical protein